MYFSGLEMEFFRGFADKDNTIVFARPNGEAGSGITYLVGPNNTGKTSVFEAIKKFKVRRKLDLKDKHNGNSSKFKVRYTTIDGKIMEGDMTTKGNLSTSSGCGLNHDFIFIDPGWETQGQEQQFPAGEYLRQLMQLRTQQAVPELFTLNFVQDIILRRQEEFNLFLNQLAPNFPNWTCETEDGVDTLYYFDPETNQARKFSTLGKGVLWSFKLATALFACKTDLPDPSGIIICIDEPENFLHPKSQIRLLKYLAEIAKKQQIFIITHSPHLIDFNYLKNGAKLAYFNKKNEVCRIKNLNLQDENNAFNKIIKNIKQPYLVDFKAKDLFFNDNILFLEGLDDVACFESFIASHHPDVNFTIFGYGCGGAGNIKSFLELCDYLGIKAAAVFDGDAQGMGCATACKKKFGNKFLIENHSEKDIRDKEGLFEEIQKVIQQNYPNDFQERIAKLEELCAPAHFKKTGFFTSKFVIKEEEYYQVEFRSLIDRIRDHFQDKLIQQKSEATVPEEESIPR